MSPLVAYHATSRKCRDSIGDDGLIACQPMRGRPHGVYVYRDDDSIDHPTFTRAGPIRWGCFGGPYGSDLWRIAYVGPLTSDHYVTNALICLDSIPPSAITLITRN